MPKKKRLFTKDNSQKFLLVHGHNDAVNADGEVLQNVLVPVSSNYKSGTSLLLSGIADKCNLEQDKEAKALSLKNIMEDFKDSDSEIIIQDDTIDSTQNSLSESFLGKETDIPLSYVFDKMKLGGFFDVEEYESVEEEEDDDDDIILDKNCPESIKMYNEKFKKIFEEYDDDQIGAVSDDEDNIFGLSSGPSQRLEHFMNSEEDKIEEELIFGNYDEDMKGKILHYAEDETEEPISEIVIEKPLEFDCESILSTYSNIYNHPTVIKEERIKKIQVPDNPLKSKLRKSQLKMLNSEKESDDEEDQSDDNVSTASTAFNVRSKRETPEQRRERKSLFKEAKRESRMLKKENKLAFKKEKQLQTVQSINAQRNAGVRLL